MDCSCVTYLSQKESRLSKDFESKNNLWFWKLSVLLVDHSGFIWFPGSAGCAGLSGRLRPGIQIRSWWRPERVQGGSQEMPRWNHRVHQHRCPQRSRCVRVRSETQIHLLTVIWLNSYPEWNLAVEMSESNHFRHNKIRPRRKSDLFGCKHLLCQKPKYNYNVEKREFISMLKKYKTRNVKTGLMLKLYFFVVAVLHFELKPIVEIFWNHSQSVFLNSEMKQRQSILLVQKVEPVLGKLSFTMGCTMWGKLAMYDMINIAMMT